MNRASVSGNQGRVKAADGPATGRRDITAHRRHPGQHDHRPGCSTPSSCTSTPRRVDSFISRVIRRCGNACNAPLLCADTSTKTGSPSVRMQVGRTPVAAFDDRILELAQRQRLLSATFRHITVMAGTTCA